jgi:hypothetical protein
MSGLRLLPACFRIQRPLHKVAIIRDQYGDGLPFEPVTASVDGVVLDPPASLMQTRETAPTPDCRGRVVRKTLVAVADDACQLPGSVFQLPNL